MSCIDWESQQKRQRGKIAETIRTSTANTQIEAEERKKIKGGQVKVKKGWKDFTG